jgi:serine/threonine protein kinase
MHEREILLAALEKAQPQERENYLAEACGSDAVLRSRVDALLRASEVQDSFLERPALETELLSPETDAIRQKCAERDELSFDFFRPSDDPQALGRLGPYEVMEVIGRGGMGVVLKARDTKLLRVVAIKVLAPELASNPTARKRFQREAHAAAAVVHQHIVTIHAVDEDRLPYLVMECINGQSLKEKIDREGHLPLVEILRIGQQVAAGLAAAHAHGLIHRDVKPANILLENGVERVRITDFGLARAVDDVGMTRTGEVAGTPQYMSPEQAQGLPIDSRSDLFSFGCVLYAMCTGRPPFRAETAFATARRVCEDTPRPIREINPEIPEWLTAIINRLLAKKPDERYSTAAEVAGLLGQQLAQLQHPSLPAALATGVPQSKIHNSKSRIDRRRWSLVAAAAVVLLVLGVSLTEATGVTQFAPTLVRIVTGEGTLVVEVNDPAVKVTVEGDGGLVIAGAGLHEVRLKPGHYQLRADKNGQRLPLTQELVTITRSNKEVVHVRLEAAEIGAAAGPKLKSGAFVLLGGKGVSERKFDTLAAAVWVASEGDTIEIRGNGPFVCGPTKITVPLTIRAGEGSQPIIKFQSEGSRVPGAFLETESALVLEGLALHCVLRDWKAGDPLSVFLNSSNALRIANCRFLMQTNGHCIHTCSVTELRNCEFLVPKTYGAGVVNIFLRESARRLVVDNCLLTDSVRVTHERADAQGALVQLTRNTILTNYWGGVWLQEQQMAPRTENMNQRPTLLSIKTSGNIIDASCVFQFEQWPPEKVLPSREAEAYVARVVDWSGKRNLYAGGDLLFRLNTSGAGFVDAANPVKNLEDWRRFWGTEEINSLEGRVRYQGGNLRARLEASAEQLTPEDFRLRADSAGYRAGEDGKDLGADVDLVGPGEAYALWKKTPEYQQWREQTGQAK